MCNRHCNRSTTDDQNEHTHTHTELGWVDCKSVDKIVDNRHRNLYDLQHQK